MRKSVQVQEEDEEEDEDQDKDKEQKQTAPPQTRSGHTSIQTRGIPVLFE